MDFSVQWTDTCPWATEIWATVRPSIIPFIPLLFKTYMPKYCAPCFVLKTLKKKTKLPYLGLITDPFNAFSYFQEPPIISLTAWSNHIHFLLFFLPLKCFRSIVPSFCVFPLFSFPLFVQVTFCLSVIYNGSRDHIHYSPFLFLCIGQCWLEMVVFNLIMALQPSTIQRSLGSFVTHGT